MKIPDILMPFFYESKSRYPFYSSGFGLEQFFFRYFSARTYKGKRYLPIAFTRIMNVEPSLRAVVRQFFIENRAEIEENYYVVSQHDDAPFGLLDSLAILNLNAGGNSVNEYSVPIPLFSGCYSNRLGLSGLTYSKNKIGSFRGSLTHPIREQIRSALGSRPSFSIRVGQWSSAPSSVEFENMISDFKTSYYSLCPRGYGPTSFRLYESIWAGVIPVYISDCYWLPKICLQDEFELAIIKIRPDCIENIEEFLRRDLARNYRLRLDALKKLRPRVCNIYNFFDEVLD